MKNSCTKTKSMLNKEKKKLCIHKKKKMFVLNKNIWGEQAQIAVVFAGNTVIFV